MFEFSVWAAALFTFLGIFFTNLFQFLLGRKVEANNHQQVFIDNIQEEIRRLQERVDRLEEQNARLHDENTRLQDELGSVREEKAVLRFENKSLKEEMSKCDCKRKGDRNEV